MCAKFTQDLLFIWIVECLPLREELLDHRWVLRDSALLGCCHLCNGD